MNKTLNHKAWLFVLPVVVLVAFNAIIPLMTVINFSVQESFGDNVFFWAGMRWFEQVLHSERFHAALLRQLLFTGIVLAIEIPLGLAIALAMPRRGSGYRSASFSWRCRCLYRGTWLAPCGTSSPSQTSAFSAS